MAGRMNRTNAVLFRKLLVVAAIMFGFGYLLVPFYRSFCEAVGITAQQRQNARDANTQVDYSRTVTVELDANLNEKLPWRFKPSQPSVKVHPGELVQVDYDVTNTADLKMVGQAVPSYAPALAARHFRKLECFCFTSQTLAAHETRRMPVVFVVEKSLPADVPVITLSYTFFLQPAADGKAGRTAAADGKGGAS